LDGIALTDKDKERVKNDHIVLTKEIISDSIKGASTSTSSKQTAAATSATPTTYQGTNNPPTPLSSSV
jgi:hypothetical protein